MQKGDCAKRGLSPFSCPLFYSMDINEFKNLPVMGILRNITISDLQPLLETVINAGLKTIEIALNTKNAIKLIKEAVKFSSGRLTIGAGTVLNKEDAKKAIDAGVTFIVTPVLIDEVAGFCAENRIPHFPGALTPTEIYNAWQKGATMVKVFPASMFGPSYFREIKGPFNKIELMAVGGVTPENVQQYFSNGASAVAFGASIFRKEWIDKKDFASIEKKVRRFLSLF